MNNKHILDLTYRLSQSLDQNYDVVNMDTVLSVITALEGTTITKEQLEATRLAKYINQLRRRTKCENLARRAKSLLKKWREMVGIQQSNESSAGAITTVTVSATSTNNISSTPVSSMCTMPVTDNAMTTSHLPNELSHTQYQRQTQYQSDVKPTHVQQQQQPYRSQPSSPVNLIEKSNPNEFLISMSNPATSQLPKSSSTNVRKKKRLEKELTTQKQQQQPTSFANLLTGLSSGTISSTRKVSREKPETFISSLKPVETFVIEHSSNSNSDLICLPSNNSNYTSATDVPPVVIDLQDTNSSINSLVSKSKTTSKKSKKEKKRKDRTVISRQNQILQDCDDQNTTPSSQNKRTSNMLLLDEKSHSACPTISNISEILSLSNSSMSSVFPSTDIMSKNNFLPAINELAPTSEKISKTELTFAGKFKQNTSTSSAGACNILNYNSDVTNVNILNSNSPNQKKISLFGGIAGIGNNSNDSTSNSRTSQFNVATTVEAARQEASNSKYNIEDVSLKHISEKSMSNMSNKGNSSTDNTFAVGTLNISNTQQQSIDLTTMDYPSEQNVKQPKKRGRKKGSKGVDSVIAKETSLSSQMLISSLSIAGKKVKTTKELYAEMENRKLRNVKDVAAANSSTNWTAQTQQKPIISRRASFFSDVAESDSCTMTSEPSRDSGNTLSKNLVKRETTLDNNSNYSKNDTELKMMSDDLTKSTVIDPNSTTDITKIRQELEEFLKQFSPTLISEIENEGLKCLIPCTCTVEEVIAPTETVANGCDNETNNSTDFKFNADNEKETDHYLKPEQIKTEIDNIKVEEKTKEQDTLPQTKTPATVKKSIFDLDFDEDEDPLNSIIADIAGKKLNTEKEDLKIMPIVVEDAPLKIEDDIAKVEQQNGVESIMIPTNTEDLVVLPSYEVKYDPNCEAKNRFEVQTQKICKFHIDTLHNYFIPNVNGNWNHADIVKPNLSGGTLSKTEDHNLTSDGYDVVPSYGSDITEQIAKDLSHVAFTKNFQVKDTKCNNEILYHIPFLGVSRIPEDVGINMQMSEYQNPDEEKENINDQLCLNNNISTSALHLNDGTCSDDAKDREKQEQNISDSSNKKLFKLKHTKKNATLIKRSTIKRLKLTEKENVTNNDSDSEYSGECSYYSNDDDDDVNSDLNKIEDFKYDIVTTLTEPLGDNRPQHIVSNTKKSHSKANFPLSPHSKNLLETDNQYLANYNTLKRRSANKKNLKLYNNLFYHDEIYPISRFGTQRECIFQISSDSSGDEEMPIRFNRQRTMSSSSSNTLASSSNKYEGQILNLQKNIIQMELAKLQNVIEEDFKTEVSEHEEGDKTNKDIDDDLPEENNGLLLSFNNIYYKSTRENINTEQNFDQQKPENKDDENMLKQQLQKCDDYNNLNNNNFNLIKYIDNETSTVNNNNNNSFSNSYSDTNIISISSSSSNCNQEKPTNSYATPSPLSTLNCKNLNNNDNNKNNDNVQNIKPFNEYQTGLRAVDEDVNDDDGNNCGRLQQFKEWHEVLQLESYNDELLTVLPYVVLE